MAQLQDAVKEMTIEGKVCIFPSLLDDRSLIVRPFALQTSSAADASAEEVDGEYDDADEDDDEGPAMDMEAYEESGMLEEEEDEVGWEERSSNPSLFSLCVLYHVAFLFLRPLLSPAQYKLMKLQVVTASFRPGRTIWTSRTTSIIRLRGYGSMVMMRWAVWRVLTFLVPVLHGDHIHDIAWHWAE